MPYRFGRSHGCFVVLPHTQAVKALGRENMTIECPKFFRAVGGLFKGLLFRA